MKIRKTLYLSAAAVSMAASAMLASCNDEPEATPAEELYLRNFIMNYGLIDPEQDWNMASSTSLTLVGDDTPRDVNVYVSCGGTLRRVAEYRKVGEGLTRLDLDVPVWTKALYVESFGEMKMAELDSEVRLEEFPTKDGSTSNTPVYEDMAWIIAGEDLGSTDDMDFNDIVLRIESVAVNYKGALSSSDWQVMEGQDGWIDISKDKTAESRGDEKLTSKRIRIKALAAGGTLPLWLHYRLDNTYDYIIGRNEDGTSMVTAASIDEAAADRLEWHRWFGFDRENIMINTGLSTGGTSTPTGSAEALGIATVYVGDDFKLENYSFVDYANASGAGDKEGWEWSTGDLAAYGIQGFYITIGSHKIEDCKRALYAPHKGAAPQIFLIPDVGADGDLWHWPTERTNISTVYPGFTDWVSNPGNNDWFSIYADKARDGVDYMRK